MHGDPEQQEQAPEGFELMGQLGEGATARVYHAHHQVYGEVALKLWKHTVTETHRRLFIRECDVAREHRRNDRLASILWADIDATGRPWIALELYEHSLAQVLEKGAPSAAEARILALDIVDGLSALHRQNHIHRDIKPSNILIRDGRACLADFGLTKGVDAATRDERAGTDGWLAPELVAGRAKADKRTDVYAAGLVLGRLLPSGDRSHVDRVVTRATSDHPPDRYPDAAALATALREALTPDAGTLAENTRRRDRGDLPTVMNPDTPAPGPDAGESDASVAARRPGWRLHLMHFGPPALIIVAAALVVAAAFLP